MPHNTQSLKKKLKFNYMVVREEPDTMICLEFQKNYKKYSLTCALWGFKLLGTFRYCGHTAKV